MSTRSTEELLADVVAELASVRSELAELRAAQRPAPDDVGADAPDDLRVTSRRRLFALAGGAAAAAVVAGTATSSLPAAAAYAAPVTIGGTANASVGPPVLTTKLDYSPTTTVADKSYFLVTDGAAAADDFPAAVAGHGLKNAITGVYGRTNNPAGNGTVGDAVAGSGATAYGLWGRADMGAAVVGQSVSGVDLYAAGTGRVLIRPFATSGPPTTGSFALGELVTDARSDFYVCYDNSVAGGRWRKLGGATTAGALHVLTPTRVFDSRLAGMGGPITSGGHRTITISNGISLTTGAIVTLDVVPPGATAIVANLTVADAASGGFLAVTVGGATEFTASAINWTPSTPFLANGGLFRLNATRQLEVFAGGGGSTNFIIDVAGYYL